VDLNDVFFAVHAFLVTLLTLIYAMHLSSHWPCLISKWTQRFLFLLSLTVSFMVLWTIMVPSWSLAVLYGLSAVKFFISIIKYFPQAYLNYCRQSTVGWSLGNVILDLIGGIGSMSQQALDAMASGHVKEALLGVMIRLIDEVESSQMGSGTLFYCI
jgi:cystinosin